METLPLSDAKARLSEIAEEVDRTHQRVQITKNGRSYVVLISSEDLESLEATLELLSDPEAMRDVRQAQAELARGDFEPATGFLEEGLALARQVRDTWSISVAVANLGRVQLRTNGDATRALALLVEGLKLARDRNDKRVAAECVQGIAAVNAIEGRAREAARLFAGAELLLETTGAALSPAEEAIRDQFLTPLQTGLGEPTFATEWEAGRSLASEDVIALALEGRPAHAQTVASPVQP